MGLEKEDCSEEYMNDSHPWRCSQTRMKEYGLGAGGEDLGCGEISLFNLKQSFPRAATSHCPSWTEAPVSVLTTRNNVIILSGSEREKTRRKN